MKKIALLSTLSIALLASFGAQAADTTELKVIGTIKPAACTPSLSGGGTADYGTILASSLKAGQYTYLEKKQISFTITCDASTKVAYKTVDNQRSSAVFDSAMKFDNVLAARHVFGLGVVAGKNVGSYAIKALDSSADGVKGDNTYSDDKGVNWGPGLFTYLANQELGTYHSLAKTGTKVPVAFKTYTANFSIEPVLNKPENLDLKGDVPLAGSTTIEVVYL